MLFSTDCLLLKAKYDLQHEWEAAHSLYQTCLNQTAVEHDLTVDYLADNFRIQDCTEYPRSLEHHRAAWNYLQHLEERTHCTGFCIPGPPLWTSPLGPHKDSCAVAVASAFMNFASPNAQQVFIVSLVTVLFVVITMVL